jgi:hypothetical protein
MFTSKLLESIKQFIGFYINDNPTILDFKTMEITKTRYKDIIIKLNKNNLLNKDIISFKNIEISKANIKIDELYNTNKLNKHLIDNKNIEINKANFKIDELCNTNKLNKHLIDNKNIEIIKANVKIDELYNTNRLNKHLIDNKNIEILNLASKMRFATYVETIVFDNIKKSSNANLINVTKQYGIYVCYIWIKHLNIYVFTIGRTLDIRKCIIKLNSIYESDNRIILVFYGKSDQNLETMLYCKMREFSISDIKYDKTYIISIICYDKILTFFKEYISFYFECEDYEIDDNNKQYYTLDKNMLPYFNKSQISRNNDLYHPEDNITPFIELNYDSIENFWKIRNRLFDEKLAKSNM